MKKIFITGLLALTTLSIFAQQETTGSTEKEPLHLKIRKNVLRPLGKRLVHLFKRRLWYAFYVHK